MRAILVSLVCLAALGACGPKEAPDSAEAVRARAVEAQTARRRTGAELQARAVTRVIPSTYICADGHTLSVTFDNPRQMATVRLPDGTAVDLRQERTTDGLWYRSQTHELKGSGRQADWTVRGQPTLACRAVA